MKSLKKFTKKMLKNQRGQGMVEYVLLLVIVVGLIMMFKDRIKPLIEGQIGDIQGKIQDIGK